MDLNVKGLVNFFNVYLTAQAQVNNILHLLNVSYIVVTLKTKKITKWCFDMKFVPKDVLLSCFSLSDL